VTTGTTRAPAPAPAPEAGHRSARSAGGTVTAAVVRQVRRGTAIVAVLCGGLVAIVVVQYRGLEGAIGLSSLSALAENPAIRTLFGPPVALDDPGGFTVWRTGTVIAVLVGVWGALTATRVTRGEEEAGRWDLLLAGRIHLRSLVLRHLVVLLGAAAVIGAAVVAGLLLSGAEGTGAVLFGAAVAGTGMTGAAAGVLAAQLLPERRAASGLAVAVLIGGLLARMVADGVPALAWMQWATPFGLIGRTAPFAENRVFPLLVLAGLVAVPAVLAVALAPGRDVGSGRLSARDRRRARSRLLGSLTGLAVRRTSRPALGWGAGLAAYFLLIGVLATAMIDFLRENPVFARLAAQAGFAQLGSVEGYVASLFGVLAVPVGAFTASRVAAAAADETAGRLALLYSLPVGRARWAVTEAATVTVASVVLAGVAGLATWAGTAWVGAGLGAGDALAGALSVVPVALLCLGAALAALGWAPSAVIPIGVLPAVGGYLLLVLADTLRWPEWVRWWSPFAHLAPVPAAPMNVAGAAGAVAVAVLLGVVGIARYARRDLRA
jgi:ABC-2 type transport system permease protein